MKKRLLIATLCIVLSTTSINVFMNNTATKATAAEHPGIELYGNITGYIYKYIDGKRYKRLWSYSYKRWEEPGWTPA